jgi:hypothetical protein
MVTLVPSLRNFIFLTPLVFCACYETSGNHHDTVEDVNPEPDHYSDDGLAEEEDVPENLDADSDPVPECHLAAIGDSRQITFNTAYGAWARRARLVYTGTEFGLFWNDNREVPPFVYELYFTRLSLEGEKLAEDIWLEELEPALGYAVFSGSEYAIAYGRMIGDHLSHELHFARISLEGGVTQDTIVLTNAMPDFETPYIVFTGSGYGLVWTSNVEGVEDRDFNINLLLLDLEGAVLGDVKKLVEGPWDSFTEWTETVFTGSEFALLWQQGGLTPHDAFLARFSSDGTQLGVPTTVFSDTETYNPQLAYGDSHFGVLFIASGPTLLDYSFSLALLSSDGELQGDDIRVVSGLSQYGVPKELVSGEDGFCAAWLNAGEYRIYGVLVGSDGVVAGPESPLTLEGVNSSSVDTFSLVSAGEEYALAWSSGANLYFTRIGCL